MTRVVHMTSTHQALDIRVFHKECVTLARNGFSVTLIVPHHQHEVVEGVTIHAIPKPKNRLHRLCITPWRILIAALGTNGTIFHFHDVELIPIGIALKILGKKVIYDVHEHQPYKIRYISRTPPWMKKVLVPLIQILEYTAGKICDGIVTASPAMGQRFPVSKREAICNFASIESIERTPYDQRPLWLIYIGILSEVRGITELTTAMSLLPNNLSVELLLVGEFSSPSYQTQLQSMPGWQRVSYFRSPPKAKMHELLFQSRMGMLLLHSNPSHAFSIPNKLFTYMAAGLPVVASHFCEWVSILEDNRCGLIIDPQDPESIAAIILWILNHPKQAEEMGARGEKAIEKKYNWETEGKKLVACYHKMLHS